MKCTKHSWDTLLNFMKVSCTEFCLNKNKKVKSFIVGALINECRNQIEVMKYKAFHPKCTICKDIINDIKAKIEHSPAEKSIVYRLKSLCNVLPNKDDCISFIEKYSEKIIKTIVDDINTQQICIEIGYCDS